MSSLPTELFPVEYDFSALAYAYSAPTLSGVMRTHALDFEVIEENPYTLSGTGEHLWCWVEKVGENTEWVAKELAKWAGIARRDVGVAGQKDRHAVTQQWFSLYLPGKADPDLSAWNHPNVRILKTVRHARKLQTGGLSGNRFVLRLRQLASPLSLTETLLELNRRVAAIQTQGVPNYFGPQRFGHNGNNLQLALKNAGDFRRVPRHKKSIYLSALRSWPFNSLLSTRVSSDSWKKLLTGDVVNLEGSTKWFVEDGSETLQQRINDGDLHITGPLIGDGNTAAQADALAIEVLLNQSFSEFFEVMRSQRMQPDRRSLSVLPKHLECHLMDASLPEMKGSEWLEIHKQHSHCSHSYPQIDSLEKLDLLISFSLPAGSYATMVLRELLQYREPKRGSDKPSDLEQE